jgi:hypothetical protein
MLSYVYGLNLNRNINYKDFRDAFVAIRTKKDSD